MSFTKRWLATFPTRPLQYTAFDLLAWLLCGWSVLYAGLLPQFSIAGRAFQIRMQYAPIMVMVGCSLILLVAMRQSQQKHRTHYWLACLALLVTQILDIVAVVPVIPAFIFGAHTQLSPGFVVYVLIYVSLIASIGMFVPFWRFPRIPVLRITLDAALLMAITDVLVRLLLPRMVPQWHWNMALLACNFRLESTLGLFFWYSRLFFRFGDARLVPIRLWLLGFSCLLINDAIVLWTTFLAPANDNVIRTAVPFWMLNQSLWTLALYRNRQSPIRWRTATANEPGEIFLPFWQQMMRLVITLATLAIVVATGPSSSSVLWFFCALVSRELLTLFERERVLDAERQARTVAEAAKRELEYINRMLRRVQFELFQTNVRYQALSHHQADLLEQRQLRAAEVAHDIANLLQDVRLTTTVISAQLQSGGKALPTDIRELLDTSDMSITAIDGLLTAMVAAAQLDAGVLNLKLVSTDLSTVVADVVRALHARADEQRVQLSIRIPFVLPSVIADASLLNRVFLNIIGNAIKFTGAAHHSDGRVQITAQVLEGYVSLFVADNGLGIAPDDLERLGQPFARGTEPPNALAGFGLGLAFARGVIEQHPGGKLTISSVEGEGTMVAVSLAMAERGIDTTNLRLEDK